MTIFGQVLIFLTIWTYMKNNLKYIAISVVFVMACLFAYQCWWLIRMYRNEVAKTESAVRTALRTSDFNEMAIRLRKSCRSRIWRRRDFNIAYIYDAISDGYAF